MRLSEILVSPTPVSRFLLLAWVLASLCIPVAAQERADVDRQALVRIADKAGELPRTHTVLVAIDGETVIERGFRGHRTNATTNIKSLSKTWIAALVGAAIDRGVIDSVDQPVVELLGDRVPVDIDARVRDITVGQLLSMQAGLERTSGGNYGGWVASRNWVANALRRPFVAEPGGPMLYSTGNSHLLSAALTEATGRSTLALMRDWLGDPLGIQVPPWTRDPQGIYFGGNEMGLTPNALLAFGEMIRNQGRVGARQVLPAAWIRDSWKARTQSIYNGDDYGYGWFTTTLAGTTVHYGWGYGGQVLFVVPDRAMTVVITSDPTPPSRGAYLDRLKDRVAALIAVH